MTDGGIVLKAPANWKREIVKATVYPVIGAALLGVLAVSCQNLPDVVTDNVAALTGAPEPQQAPNEVTRMYETVVRLEVLADALECPADYAQLEAENDFLAGQLAAVEVTHRQKMATLVAELNAEKDRADAAEKALTDIRNALGATKGEE